MAGVDKEPASGTKDQDEGLKTAVPDSSAAIASATSAAAEAWCQVWDPNSASYYYYNHVTQVSQFETPEEIRIAKEESDAAQEGGKAAVVGLLASSFKSYPTELRAVLRIQGTFRSKQARRAVRQVRAQQRVEAAATADDAATSSTRSDIWPWHKLNDPSTGADYFYNEKTQEVSWTLPDEDAAKSSDPKEEDGEWIEILDPGSGLYYYFNTRTQTSTWDKPASFQKFSLEDIGKHLMPPEVRAAVLVQNTWRAKVARREMRKQRGKNLRADSQGSPWQTLRDPQSGCDYYYNAGTQEVTWDMPPEIAAGSHGISGASWTWVELVDPGTSKSYFYNQKTGASVWTRPDDDTSAELGNTAKGLDDRLTDDLRAVIRIQIAFRAKIARRRVRQLRAIRFQGSSTQLWVEVLDNVTGHPYFFNTRTLEVSWDPPSRTGSTGTLASTAEPETQPSASQTEMGDHSGSGEVDANPKADVRSAEPKSGGSVPAAAAAAAESAAEAAGDKSPRGDASARGSVSYQGTAGKEESQSGDSMEGNTAVAQAPSDANASVKNEGKATSIGEIASGGPDNGLTIPDKSADDDEDATGASSEEDEDEDADGADDGHPAKQKGNDMLAPLSSRFSARRLDAQSEASSPPAPLEDEGLPNDEDDEEEEPGLSAGAQRKLRMIEVAAVINTKRFDMLRELNEAASAAGVEIDARKAKSQKQSIRVAEVAADEAAASLNALDAAPDARVKEAGIPEAAKAVVFCEAQQMLAAKAIFASHVALLEQSTDRLREVENLVATNALATSRTLAMQRKLVAKNAEVARLRVKHVQLFSHRNSVSETLLEERWAKASRGSTAGVAYSSRYYVRQILKGERTEYEAAFANTREAAHEDAEGFNSELGFIVDKIEGSSPWWPTYEAAMVAVLDVWTETCQVMEFAQETLQKAREERELRRMMAEEANQRAAAASRGDLEYDLACRRAFLKVCRKAWNKGVRQRQRDQERKDSRVEDQAVGSRLAGKVSQAKAKRKKAPKTLIVRKDSYRSPWHACMAAKSSLDDFVQALEEERLRRTCQEKRSFSLDQPDPDSGRLLIHVACWYSRGDIVKYLLTQGANPNAVQSGLDRTRPIHVAARAGRSDIIEDLVGHGASLYAQDSSGDTALHWACRVESLSCVRALLTLARSQGGHADSNEGLWMLVGRVNERSRMPTELLPRDGDGVSYTGHRILKLLRQLEIQAQRMLFQADA